MATNRELNAQLRNLAEDEMLLFEHQPKKDAVEVWEKAFPTLTPRQLYERFERVSGDGDTYINIYEHQDGVITVKLCPEGMQNEATDYIVFDLNGNEASISNALLDKTGSDVAKGYIGTMANILKEEGFKKIDISTQSVGGYAWAKYGFKPESQKEWNTLKSHMKKRLDSKRFYYKNVHYPLVLTHDEQLIFNSATAANSKPEKIWRVADCLKREIGNVNGKPITVGKALLMMQEWDGVLPLDGADQGYQRLETYTAPSNIRAQEVAHR